MESVTVRCVSWQQRIKTMQWKMETNSFLRHISNVEDMKILEFYQSCNTRSSVHLYFQCCESNIFILVWSELEMPLILIFSTTKKAYIRFLVYKVFTYYSHWQIKFTNIHEKTILMYTVLNTPITRMEHARSRSRSMRRRRQTSQFPVVRRSRRPAATDHLLCSAAAIERVRSRRINSIISLWIMFNGACESVVVRVQQSVGVLCCEWIYICYIACDERVQSPHSRKLFTFYMESRRLNQFCSSIGGA